MAEATGLRNNALPYPVYGLPYGVTFPLLDADGDPTSPSSPDSEISKNGDTFADCTNEATEIATSSGVCYLLLTGTELTTDVATVRIQSTGAKTTILTLYPRKLVTIHSGTAADDGSGTGTIVLDSGASAVDDFYNGMIVAAVIDSVTEVRMITDYVGSTKTATVVPDWNTAVDNNDTFTIYLPDGVQIQQANTTLIEGSDATNQIRDAVVDDATRIDASALNTASATTIPAIDAKTTNLPSDPADQSLIIAATNDIVALLGTPAGADLAADIAGINAKTTNLPSDPADASVIAGRFDTLDTNLATVDTVVDAINAKTTNLPSDPADASVVAGLIAGVVADTEDIQARIPAALGSNGNMKADLIDVGGTAVPAGYVRAVTKTVGAGTAAGSATTTSIPTSAFSPAGAVVDQFKGRILIFANDTTTAALRGQATDITANTADATPTLTVTALTTAPASGDVFTIQ